MKRGLRLSDLIILESKEELARIPEGKVLINTINAHSYNVAQKDAVFAEALRTARSADETLSDASLRNADATKRGNATTKRHEGAYETERGSYETARGAYETEQGSYETLRYEKEKVEVGVEKYLIPDGVAIVKACRWLGAKSQPKERIAGWDLFVFEMERVNETLSDASLRNADATIRGDATTKRHEGAYEMLSDASLRNADATIRGDATTKRHEGAYETERGSYETARGAYETEQGSYETLRYEKEKVEVEVDVYVDKKRVMFMGSSERVLALIKERAAVDYPNVEVVTYSPPYKAVFSEEDNRGIIEAINRAKPDLLWIGMTAPKQEKWTYEHWGELDINCHVGTIGAVFDFYAGTAQRAPLWWQRHGLEWLYRLIREPKRMWRRYVIGNPLFVWNVVKE